MMSVTTDAFIFIGTILLIHIFAWLTPGPLFVVIIRNSLVHSRKIGVWTAVGFALGNLIHITYSVAGIALIISRSTIAFNIIKVLGISYLLYLGIKTLFMKVETKRGAPGEKKDISALSAVKIGFFTSLLSPKASLFFASIFATVLSSDYPVWVVLFLMIAMPLNTFFMASILSIFFTQKRVRSLYTRFQHIFNKCLGAALILLAVMIALSKG